MGRSLSWIANGALFVLCCFLVARTANAVIAAWLEPAPAESAPAAPPPPPVQRTWQDRQVILARNLFQASLTAPTPGAIQEDLEATQLPLDLLGTVASPNPRYSWAAVEDRETRKHLVLQVQDEIKNGRAKVMRIEPKRLVLAENGTMRELVLKSDPGTAPPVRQAAQRSAPRRSAKARPAARRNAAAARAPRIQAPLQIFQEAQIEPETDANGNITGLRLGEVTPDGLLENAGLHEGDVIVEINGMPVSNPQDAARIGAEILEGGQVSGVTADGRRWTIQLPEVGP